MGNGTLGLSISDERRLPSGSLELLKGEVHIMGIKKELFGKSLDDQDVFLYEITNGAGMTIGVSDFGATLVKILVPDKWGKLRDVALGYDSAQGYHDNPCHFGAVIGRNGNRIGGARFTLNGKEYQLAVNDNKNNLHSGPDWYRTRKWEVKETDQEKNAVVFGLYSPDMDQGFPGNFTAQVTYTLTEDNEIQIHYQGIADQDTIVNMTNHSYFNLAGHDGGRKALLEHKVQILAPEYTPVGDSESIPTGEIASVEGTPMDFRVPKKIGQDLEEDFEQLKFGGGYDHNYALTRKKGPMKKAAAAEYEESGIVMEVFTDLPGMQFYIGNFIDNEKGKGGCIYEKRGGFCMETQYYPDACNQDNFESPVLKAGDKYDTTTVYKFSVKD